MTIKRSVPCGEHEPRIGYCRAVVAGGFVHVSGTVAGPDVPDDVVAQCKSALAIIHTALSDVGVGFADTVRVRYILPDPADFQACWPVLCATFGDNPPAATMMSCALIDPKYKIEIELTALAPSA
jgi:enamine deaminase RidA (YjgF/YER057c/UK114 family)